MRAMIQRQRAYVYEQLAAAVCVASSRALLCWVMNAGMSRSALRKTKRGFVCAEARCYNEKIDLHKVSWRKVLLSGSARKGLGVLDDQSAPRRKDEEDDLASREYHFVSNENYRIFDPADDRSRWRGGAGRCGC